MRKLLLICFGFIVFNSCTIDDDNGANYDYEFLPIESVDIPEEFIFGETYSINYTYYRPSTCHSFFDLYYNVENNQRTVAVINIVYDQSDCEPLNEELMERSFNFTVLDQQTYVFKFWQGQNDVGEDLYLTYEVPVVE